MKPSAGSLTEPGGKILSKADLSGGTTPILSHRSTRPVHDEIPLSRSQASRLVFRRRSSASRRMGDEYIELYFTVGSPDG